MSDDLQSLLDEVLSPEARAALQAHLSASSASADEVDDDFGEHFGLSQFWYTDETSETLGLEAISRARAANPSACLCTRDVSFSFLHLH